MSTSNTQNPAEAFVAALRKASKDRGKMAALRRAMSPRVQVDAWPVIADLGGDLRQPVYGTIAALFATHPEESTAPNFGATCRQIALQDGGKGEVAESHERRFRRLLACDTGEELSKHLRAMIRLAASKSVGVNYQQLFTDLRNWDRFGGDIRVRWASEFWPARQTPEPPAAAEEVA